MGDATKIITLKMNTAEARDLSFALLVEAARLLNAAREEKLDTTMKAYFDTRKRMMDVRTRIDNALSDRAISGTCKHGVAFSTPCPECLAYFSSEKKND